jgi:hypothetical protein
LENPKKRDRLEDYARCQDNNKICLEAVGWENKDWIVWLRTTTRYVVLKLQDLYKAGESFTS